jgi:hypothetical protein
MANQLLAETKRENTQCLLYHRNGKLSYKKYDYSDGSGTNETLYDNKGKVIASRSMGRNGNVNVQLYEITEKDNIVTAKSKSSFSGYWTIVRHVKPTEVYHNYNYLSFKDGYDNQKEIDELKKQVNKLFEKFLKSLNQ